MWFTHCCTCVVLALNRCVEIHSQDHARVLFNGYRVYLWLIPTLLYGFLFTTTLVVPPIYNSEWSVYYFQIDFSPEAEPVTNWICFLNCAWVIIALVVIYTLMFRKMREMASRYGKRELGESRKISSMQRKAALQSFVICGALFVVVFTYAVGGFMRMPNPLLKFATMLVQVCTGSTAIVYLVINNTIRNEVKRMLERVRKRLLGVRKQRLESDLTHKVTFTKSTTRSR